MAGIKRKEGPKAAAIPAALPSKKQRTGSAKHEKSTKQKRPPPVAADLPESDTTEDDNEMDDIPDGVKIESEGNTSDVEDEVEDQKPKKSAANANRDAGDKKFKVQTTSAEAHAEQRRLAKERKAAKPNADSIARSKKIWERLRRKSHVPLEERKALVAELFEIITGRVRDFVFKHDSVRVIQCALKYANKEQRRSIARELQADIRSLSESKYGKFLVGKMIVEGDESVRDMVVPEFYGHVRRLINQPEASWIMDDIYRQVATPTQKALMLREWYGAEFAVFGKTKGAAASDTEATADLKQILEKSPEKKKPIMQYLHQMINQLIQKKMTGFTMLHDAMLQYFLNTEPGTPEATEFLELLKSDLDENQGGDLLKNLAFTKSGSRVVCLALAYGGAKDRKVILKVYKDTVEMMAFDAHAYMVLLAAMDVTDDTKMSAKAIFPELLGESISDTTEREDRLLGISTHATARIPLLYPLAGQAKWLLTDAQKASLVEIHAIRETTSKKNAETRRMELVQALSPSLLSFVANRAADLVASSFGCQVVSEVLLECVGDKSAAISAVAETAGGDPTSSDHLVHSTAAGKMFKTLASGGKFDFASKKLVRVEPALKVGDALYDVIKDHLVSWACGPSSFVPVAMLESEDLDAGKRKEMEKLLKKGKKELEKAAKGEGAAARKEVDEDGEKKNKKRKVETSRGNAGAKILLEKLA